MTVFGNVFISCVPTGSKDFLALMEFIYNILRMSNGVTGEFTRDIHGFLFLQSAIINKAHEWHSGLSKPRSGRPKRPNETDKSTSSLCYGSEVLGDVFNSIIFLNSKDGGKI